MQAPKAEPRSDGWIARAARRPALRTLVLALALTVVAAAAFSALRPRRLDHEYGSDETQYVVVSIHLIQQLFHGAPVAGGDSELLEHPNPWRAGVHATNWGFHVPALPKLVWGTTLDLAGYRDASLYVFGVYWQGDREKFRAAQKPLLTAIPWVRGVSLLVAASSAVLIFFIGKALAGWSGGGIAFALWLGSPLLYERSTYIRIDFFQLTFSLATLLVAIRARESLSGRRGSLRAVTTALLLGVLGGCAVSCKLSGAYNVLFVLAVIPILRWRVPGSTRGSFVRGSLISMFMAGAAALLVFYLLNPALWADPVGGVRAIVDRWNGLFVMMHEWPVDKANTLVEKVRLASNKVAGYEPLSDTFGTRYFSLIAVAGAALLLFRMRGGEEGDDARARRELARIVACYAVLSFVVVTLWLSLGVVRYFMPYQPSVVLLDAMLLGALVAGAGNLIRTKRGAGPGHAG